MTDKYESIRRMSKEDRKAIYDFAMKRSKEMLRGDDELAETVEANPTPGKGEDSDD